MRSFREYFILLLKGVGMGVADVIPGVSGGTIAFISGIYEELINALRSINGSSLGLLIRGRLPSFMKQINGWFLAAVFGGVAISIFSLARLMKWLLINHPIPVWAFFFGLILISSFFVLKKAGRMNVAKSFSFLAGIAVALIITSVTPVNTTDAWWFIIISGAVAICAMILPGISGAFILLLLGKYQFMITAVSEMDIVVILLFLSGAATGLVLFSNFLAWLLKNYHDITIAVLAGFMIGSLKKVWPWKIFTHEASAINHSLPVTESNVLPAAYRAAGSGDPLVAGAIILFIAGITLFLLLEMAGKRTGR